jgi:hypothetical protein
MAEAAADGAIFEAIFNLTDPQAAQRWPIDGAAHELIVGESRVMVRLEDEAQWINPNMASPALLASDWERPRERTTPGDRDRRMGGFRVR